MENKRNSGEGVRYIGMLCAISVQTKNLLMIYKIT